MKFTNALALAGAFALSVTAAPVESTANSKYTITAEQITSIDSKTASCSGAPFPQECADAKRAAPAISASFQKYEIGCRGVQAALLAIMLFESGSFKYDRNHFPGRPGQGTRNMQMVDFNREYAAANKIAVPADANGVLEPLLKDDKLSFGSAAWYIKTKCQPSILNGLESGSQAGWEAYLTQCVGTTHTAERDVAWVAAKKALKVGQ